MYEGKNQTVAHGLSCAWKVVDVLADDYLMTSQKTCQMQAYFNIIINFWMFVSS